MNESRLDQLRSAWRETPAFDGARLEASDIDTLLRRQSRDVRRQYRVALLMDIALKSTHVRPGMQVVERYYGLLEIHSESQAETRSAGEAILPEMGLGTE